MTSEAKVLETGDSRAVRWRLFVVCLTALTCLVVIGGVFWREDLRYARPTPKPQGLVELPLGATWEYGAWAHALQVAPAEAQRPVLFNFFNPACSCSRFNLQHLHNLKARFGERVRFVAVVQTLEEDAETARRLDSLGLDMPYVLDRDGAIAGEVGVYATPQAVLVDSEARLVYRGNYNLSRYCADPQTEYVRIALEGLLSSEPVSVPAEPAYGCELPSVVAAATPSE